MAFLFDRHTPEDESWLESHANTILGMVAADATEGQLANYLRGLAPNEHSTATFEELARYEANRDPTPDE